MPEELFLPPIFARNPQLRVVSQGTRNGHPYLKFTNMDDKAPVREVVIVYVSSNRKADVHYDYSTVSPDGIVTTYSGPFGDPDRDAATPWGVINK